MPDRRAFNESPLVFLSKPESRWVRHEACVWNGPGDRNKVLKLEKLQRRYSDCKRLFCDLLGVKPADTKHVVEELCYITDEDDVPVQRFKDVICLLAHYHSTRSSLSEAQIEKIRLAPVFPILEEGHGTSEESSISWRSLSDGGWYIPDKTMLEIAFRGRVDLLSLPRKELSRKEVRTLDDLFEALRCRDMFISANVEVDIEPRGSPIPDESREDDLKTRLRYILQ